MNKCKTNSSKILIVDDSKTSAMAIAMQIDSHLSYKYDIAGSLKDASCLIEDKQNDYFIALLDLNLPDAPEGEIVDYILSKSIPSIVITGSYNEKVRNKIQAKNILNFVPKNSYEDIRYMLRLIHRIHKNIYTKILIVEDSATYRSYIKNILISQKLNVIEAENGEEALEMMEKHRDIKMVLTDYEMPVMDGYDLTLALRKKFSIDDLPILVFSGGSKENTASIFIKAGANDYISKKTTEEEVICRTHMNLEMADLVAEIMNKANKDYLTDLYNRRYFFDVSERILSNAKKSGDIVAIAMLDIDFFKKINDNYGHNVGDAAIISTARTLEAHTGEEDIIARFGGEEFCILTTAKNDKEIEEKFENIRVKISEQVIETEGNKISFTISTGITTTIAGTIDDTVNMADAALYAAKNDGRNCIRYYMR